MSAVIAFCQANKIDFVVVGPEAPLVAGIVDDLEAAGIKAFGPSKWAARLEGSKGFTKDLCKANKIPTAAYERFKGAGAGERLRAKKGAPIVVKADGLAAGKGVVVARDGRRSRSRHRHDVRRRAWASAAWEIVIEDCLVGEEASFFALCDGETAIPLASAQDHKRVFDGDKGPNTGGMGAYSPAPVMTPAMNARVMDEIMMPTVRAMKALGAPYKGVLFAGLMITKDGPQLIEYNVRFGDPESPGADAAADVGSRSGADRGARRATEEFRSALVRRCGAHRGDGGEGLSGRLRKRHGDRRPRRGGADRRRGDFSRRHKSGEAAKFSPTAGAC